MKHSKVSFWSSITLTFVFIMKECARHVQGKTGAVALSTWGRLKTPYLLFRIRTLDFIGYNDFIG